jgi:hypothetical protein
MTEIATWQFNAYHETPEHAAKVAARNGGEGTPPPEPISIAREHLSLAVRRDGYLIDLHSIREESRQAVIVDDLGDWRPTLDDEEPTGHIVRWTCSATERRSTAEEDHALPVERTEEGVTAAVTGPLREFGGGARVNHGLGAPVIVSAADENGDGMGLLFATELDDNSVHVEFFPGTASLTIVPEKASSGT